MEQEIWKDIPDYNGLYQASTLGRIKSIKRNIILKSYRNFGYEQVNIGKKCKRVHRLVAQTFIPNPLNKPQINHINAIRNDNRIENLEWCTSSENVKWGFKLGTMKSPRYWAYALGKDNCKSKGLVQYDKDNNIIKTYANVRIAAEELGLNEKSIYNHIYKHIKIMRNGFRFEYLNLVYKPKSKF